MVPMYCARHNNCMENEHCSTDCFNFIPGFAFDVGKVKTEPVAYNDAIFHGDVPLESQLFSCIKQELDPLDQHHCSRDLSYSYQRHFVPKRPMISNEHNYFSPSAFNNREFYHRSVHATPRSLKTNMVDVASPDMDKIGPVRRKKESKKAPYTTVPLPPCKVCSGTATGFHFGVITCEACKAFFRRALIHKQAYKCLKDDDCDIIDKKLGNCSACRLKKCFDVGMSKGGVRRGRYSIAIRTKAIVEAKALEGKDPAPMIPVRSPLQSSNMEITFPMGVGAKGIRSPDNTYGGSSPDSGIDMDVFDGLLEISEMNDGTDLTVTVHSPPPIMYETNPELDHLIDAIVSCQEAVYPNMKAQLAMPHQLHHAKVREEYSIKQELFGDIFGKTGSISTEEYQQIFAETGIDLDDRLLHFNRKGKSMEETIALYVNFAKIIPGFKNLNPKDVSRLLKGAHMEFWMFGSYMLMNNDLKVANGTPGVGTTREHMIKFFDPEWVDNCLAFTDTLKPLQLTAEEIALVRVIILTYTDRCTLLESEKIQSLQEKYVDCLHYLVTKTSRNPGKRLYKIFDRILAVRDLSASNVRINRKFLTEWGFLMHDYPLWKEMLSFDEV